MKDNKTAILISIGWAVLMLAIFFLLIWRGNILDEADRNTYQQIIKTAQPSDNIIIASCMQGCGNMAQDLQNMNATEDEHLLNARCKNVCQNQFGNIANACTTFTYCTK